MSQTILFRAGLPFAVVVCVDGSDGNPADLSGCSFASQIRDALGTLVATLTAEIVPDQVGVVQLRAADTTQWPLGQMWCDLDVTWPNGAVTPTEVFSITMRRGVTR